MNKPPIALGTIGAHPVQMQLAHALSELALRVFSAVSPWYSSVSENGASLAAWHDTTSIVFQLVAMWMAADLRLQKLPRPAELDSRSMHTLVAATCDLPNGFRGSSTIAQAISDTSASFRPEVQDAFGLVILALRRLGDLSIPHSRSLSVAFESINGKFPASHRGHMSLESSTRTRDGGVYLTPNGLVRFVVEETLSLGTGLASTIDEVLDLKLVDPACGAGAFILESLDFLSNLILARLAKPSRLSPREARRLVATNCLYGLDIDTLAVDVARAALWLEAGEPNEPIEGLSGHVRVGDALTSTSISPHGEDRASSDKSPFGRAFDWQAEFPEVFHRVGRAGFDFVLTNPPWGKVKPEIREFLGRIDSDILRLQGKALRRLAANKGIENRSSADGYTWREYVAEKHSYANALSQSAEYTHQRLVLGDSLANGDADLYKYFMERAYAISNAGAHLGLVVPSSFCQALGASGLRTLYFEGGELRRLYGFQNSRRIFPIHTMFKFVVLVYRKGSRRKGIGAARFRMTAVPQRPVQQSRKNGGTVRLPLDFLRAVGGAGLSVPEVRSEREASLLKKLARAHPRLGEKIQGTWSASFRREVDMTNDSSAFVPAADSHGKELERKLSASSGPDGFGRYRPLFEGRMIHQFDYEAKGYLNGHARRAIWKPLLIGEKGIYPHFYVDTAALRIPDTELRVPRAGFCDVTGEQNERTVLAALIPAGYPCGNKVPTLRFDSEDPRLPLLWIGLANSFVVDWMLRRFLSTTLNFFHWRNIPFPRLDPNGPVAEQVISMAASLSVIEPEMEDSHTSQIVGVLAAGLGARLPLSYTTRAKVRARLDALVADLFGLDAEEYAIVLEDFPLLDRNQPTLILSGQQERGRAVTRSTVTKDLALSEFMYLKGENLPSASRLFPRHPSGITDIVERLHLAAEAGAVGYIPSEHARRLRLNEKNGLSPAATFNR